MLFLKCQHYPRLWSETLDISFAHIIMLNFFPPGEAYGFCYMYAQNQGNIAKWLKKEGDKVSCV